MNVFKKLYVFTKIQILKKEIFFKQNAFYWELLCIEARNDDDVLFCSVTYFIKILA